VKGKSLDFIIDKLTRSIENVVTGDSFPTDISLVSRNELKSVTKSNGWVFNWLFEFKQPARVILKTNAGPRLIDKYFPTK
jgi:hypothetical protein